MYARDRERRMVMKPYVKPELHYESFELAQHIAACYYSYSTTGPNHTDVHSCSVLDQYSGLTFFANDNNCINGEPEGYCYTNGSGNFTTWNS